jgi:hypothetical protein
MKTKIVLFCLVFCTLFLSAQNLSTSYLKTPVFKDDFKDSKIVLAEKDGKEGLMILRSYKVNMHEGFYLEHYDSNLKLINNYKFETHNSLSEMYNTQLGVIRVDNKIHSMNIYYDLKEKAYICQAHTIDFLNLATEKKELFRFTKDQIKELGTFLLPQVYSLFSDEVVTDKTKRVAMIINENKSSFVIELNLSSDEKVFRKLFLFDKSLNQKYIYDFKREIGKNDFKCGDISLSDDGNVIYVLGKESGYKKEEGGDYQFELTKITANAEISKKIDTENHFSSALKIINFDEKVVCLGFYSDRNDYRYKGICYYQLNSETLNVDKIKFNPFSEQFIIDKYGIEKQKELKDLVVKNVFKTKNNEIVFNAQEELIVYSGNYTQGGGGHTFYVFNDIVSAKINLDGALMWARNINKSQSVMDPQKIPFISYSSIINEKEVCFFINSDEKVNRISKNRVEFDDVGINKSNINVVRINENGDFDYKEVLNHKENEVPFMISKGIILDNSVFFLGRKGSLKQILKINLL